MKIKSLFFVLACVSAVSWAADAPKIDDKRIDVVIQQYETTGGKVTSEQKAEMRKQILQELQQAEVLKNAALQAGLDKQANVQLALQNVQAQFYATQYVEHLKNSVAVSDADLQQLYARLGREVKIQMAAFKTQEEVTAAQDKLKKGMSFSDLIATLPEQPASPPDFISPQMLPSEFASVLDNMDKGKITDNAVQFQGQFYLLKIADMRRGDKVPAFEQIKERLIEQRKAELVREKIQQLFKQYGLD